MNHNLPMAALLGLSLQVYAQSVQDIETFQKSAKDKDPDRRCEAIDGIKKLKTPKMVELLIPLLGDEHARVRYRAVRALGAIEEKAAIDVLAKLGLKSGNGKIRAGATEALGWVKSKEVIPPLVQALADGDLEVRAQAASALGWRRAEEAVDRLIELFEKDSAWLARANALEAVTKIAPSKAAEIAAKACEDKTYSLRLTGIQCLSKADPAAASTLCGKLINDSDWRVRVAVIEATPDIRTRECIGFLIDRFLQEKGRLRWDLILALQDLTGRDLGLDPNSWKTWWEANKASFDVPPKQDGRSSGGRLSGGTVASFFKVPILSTRMAFILDLSGSMRDKAVEKGSAGGKTKLDVAKEGMTRTIADFSTDVQFNVVLLGSDKNGRYDKNGKIWRKSLTPASPANKQAALDFIKKQEARGWTNIYDAVEYAFEDPDVDTLYLYSDGGASRGIFVSTWEIVEFIKRMNRFRKVMIHTVEVPGEKNTTDNVKLLTELAEETKGIYLPPEP